MNIGKKTQCKALSGDERYCLENLSEPTKNYQNKAVNKFIIYKITIQKSIAFLYTSDNLLEYVMGKNQLTIVAKSIKKPRNKLSKEHENPI